MAEDERELERTSNELLDELRELQRLEAEKRTVPVASRRFRELAEAIVRKSRAIFQHATLQEQLGDQADAEARSIDDIRAGGGGNH